MWEDELRKIWNSAHALDDEVWKKFLTCWRKEKTLKRNEFLDEPGKTEDTLYIVISGAMRLYYPMEEEEICVGFAYPPSLICSYPSFISQQPSTYFIQALRETSLVGISRKDFYDLMLQNISLERAWRILQEKALLGKIERETELLTFTPEQRLKRLWQRSPQLFQIIPRKYIASYLRMTPETLSRLKP